MQETEREGGAELHGSRVKCKYYRISYVDTPIPYISTPSDVHDLQSSIRALIKIEETIVKSSEVLF